MLVTFFFEMQRLNTILQIYAIMEPNENCSKSTKTYGTKPKQIKTNTFKYSLVSMFKIQLFGKGTQSI